MAAPQGNQNGIGNRGGKSLQDRKLAAEVRSLTLTKIKQLLETPAVERTGYEDELYKAVLIRLAGTVLPRLNEVTGADGEALNLGVVVLPAKQAMNADSLEAPAETSGGSEQN